MPIAFPSIPEPMWGGKNDKELFERSMKLYRLQGKIIGLYTSTFNPFAFKARREFSRLMSRFTIELADYTDSVYADISSRFKSK